MPVLDKVCFVVRGDPAADASTALRECRLDDHQARHEFGMLVGEHGGDRAARAVSDEDARCVGAVAEQACDRSGLFPQRVAE